MGKKLKKAASIVTFGLSDAFYSLAVKPIQDGFSSAMGSFAPDMSAINDAAALLGQSLNGGKVENWSTMYKAYASEKATLNTEMTNALSREKAVMAAGGLLQGSEGWNQRLDLISKDYAKRINDLKSGATFGALTDYYNKSGGSGDVEGWLKGAFPNVATVATRDASKAGDTAAQQEKINAGSVQAAAAMSEEEKRKTNVNPWLA